MNEIQWGMIGCGNVTEKKAGAPAINKVLHSKLVAVMARNAEKAKDYAQRHKVPKWYDNVDDLINDPNINAIYIATHRMCILNIQEKRCKQVSQYM